MATRSLLEQSQDLAQQNQVTPSLGEFDETKGVAGRVDSLVAKESPLMQRAATKASQSLAPRGLTNSSIAIGEGQKAVIDSAVPIATVDANLNQQQNLTNQTAKNNASTTNAQIGATLGGQALGLENSNKQQDKSLLESARQFNTSAGQQQQQIDAQIEQFAKSLGMTAQDLALRRDSLTQQQQQFLDNLNLQKSQLSQQQSQFDVNAAQNQQQINNQSTQFGQSLAEQQKERAQQDRQFKEEQQFRGIQSNLDRNNAVKLEELRNKNQLDINGNGNITQAWQQMSVNIANIQNNPNIESAAKRVLIQNQMDSFASFAEFWKKAGNGNVDISDLLDFNVGGSPAIPGAPRPPPTPGGGTGGGSGNALPGGTYES